MSGSFHAPLEFGWVFFVEPVFSLKRFDLGPVFGETRIYAIEECLRLDLLRSRDDTQHERCGSDGVWKCIADEIERVHCVDPRGKF